MKQEEQWALQSRTMPTRSLVSDRQMHSSISILVIGILITLLIWIFERHSSITSERDRFLLITDALVSETEARLSALGDTLRSHAALLVTSELVTNSDWQIFSSLMRPRDPPSFLRFLWYFKIFRNSAEYQSFISTPANMALRQRGLSAPPATYPAAMLISASPHYTDGEINTRISSLLSSPHFANAIASASSSRDPLSFSIGPPIQGVPTPNGAITSKASTLLTPLFDNAGYADVSRKLVKPIDQITGLLIAELDLRQFAEDILNDSSKFSNSLVHLEIVDAKQRQAQSKQPQHRRGRGQRPANFQVQNRVVEMTAYGQTWLLQFSSTPQLGLLRRTYMPAAILVAGFIISVLLSILIWSIDRRKSEAIAGERRLQSIVNIAPDTIIVTDCDNNILMFNQSATQTFGYAPNEIVGQHFSILAPLPNRTAGKAELSQIAQDSEAAHKLTVQDRVYGLHKSGRQFPIELAISKVWEGNDCFHTIVARDISSLKASERKIDFLIQEIQHRSKNMASLFLAMARESAGAQSPSFLESFAERVAASSACNDLFTRSGKDELALETVITSQIQHFAGSTPDRFNLKGPACTITLDAAQSIGMTIHELAMNAAKYGALSVAHGRVRILWQLEAEDNVDYFSMEWVESGGPPVKIPTQSGFGTTVIRSMLEFGLEATTEVEYPTTGLVWRMRCKAEDIFAASHTK